MRPLAFWIALRSSLWFVPALVALGSIVVGQGLVELQSAIPTLAQSSLPSFLRFGAEGSRAMLSSIATSMITVAGVAFSVTIVALSLASSQYSPRVLRQFMRDRANQWVLGVFVGVFSFSLTVLPSVRGDDHGSFVPTLAVAFAVVYALAGVGCLIFFVHHVATSIQASCIVAEIAGEARAAADALYPDRLGEQDDASATPENEEGWRPIAAPISGYIQIMEEARLVRLAVQNEMQIRLEHAVGEFVPAGALLASIRATGRKPLPASEQVAAAFTLDHTRTVEQDLLFGVRQIVDVALRALSPALNDPTTAILCVDYLSVLIRQVADRRLGRPQHWAEGALRLIGRAPTFAELLGAAFHEIRVNAREHARVLAAIVTALDTIAEVTRHPQRRAAVAAEVRAIRAQLAGAPAALSTRECEARADRLLRELAPAASAWGPDVSRES